MYCLQVQETQFYGLTVRKNESVGVIGVVCPETCPLLGFVSLMAPAVARGNAVVMVPSERWPLAGLAFHQVGVCGLIGGVICGRFRVCVCVVSVLPK